MDVLSCWFANFDTAPDLLAENKRRLGHVIRNTPGDVLSVCHEAQNTKRGI